MHLNNRRHRFRRNPCKLASDGSGGPPNLQQHRHGRIGGNFPKGVNVRVQTGGVALSINGGFAISRRKPSASLGLMSVSKVVQSGRATNANTDKGHRKASHARRQASFVEFFSRSGSSHAMRRAGRNVFPVDHSADRFSPKVPTFTIELSNSDEVKIAEQLLHFTMPKAVHFGLIVRDLNIDEMIH